MSKPVEVPLFISEDRVNEAGLTLNDQSKSLAVRFRALFLLRNVKDNLSVKWICKCFMDPSALLKHELAYCLGQMQNQSAIPHLINVLQNIEQESMVRHEAAEALAAIGDPLNLHGTSKILQAYCNDPVKEVAETCQLAVERIQWANEMNGDTGKKSIYDSIDPSPPIEGDESSDIIELGRILTDKNQTLWNRYRAMFSLRNLNTNQATKVLASGLFCEESALFRHEVAYVLGQIQSPIVISELKSRLQMYEENGMVRHECAEALGSIGTVECQEILKQYLHDEERVVRESCEVALDIIECNK